MVTPLSAWRKGNSQTMHISLSLSLNRGRPCLTTKSGESWTRLWNFISCCCRRISAALLHYISWKGDSYSFSRYQNFPPTSFFFSSAQDWKFVYFFHFSVCSCCEHGNCRSERQMTRQQAAILLLLQTRHYLYSNSKLSGKWSWLSLSKEEEQSCAKGGKSSFQQDLLALRTCFLLRLCSDANLISLGLSWMARNL